MPGTEHSISAALQSIEDTMPAAVAQRLQATIEAEVARRSSGRSARDEAEELAAVAKRTELGTFGVNVPTRLDRKQVSDHVTH